MSENEIIKNTAAQLECKSEVLCTKMPQKEAVRNIINDLRALLFPEYFIGSCKEECAETMLGAIYTSLKEQICAALTYSYKGEKKDAAAEAESVCADFISKLPSIKKKLWLDVEAGYNGDPAAKSKEDIIISYPGMLAVFVYRIAHELYVKNVPLIPRMMTEYAHSRSGIDINAGADIGEYFFIDHGTGVVIGETAKIGDRVKIYQGVTLGALSTRMGQQLSGVKRHPTIEDDVTIYANASVLGGETVIGKGSIIGGSAFITSSIPPMTKVIVKNENQHLIYSKQESKKWEI